MKWLPLLLACVPLAMPAADSYFFEFAGQPEPGEVEGERLHLTVPIRRIEAPEANSLSAFHQGLGEGRDYKIQVNLRKSPPKGWMPMLKLRGEIVMEGISVTVPSDPRFASSFSLESDDPKVIERWCELLAEILQLPKERMSVDLKPSEKKQAVPEDDVSPDPAD